MALPERTELLFGISSAIVPMLFFFVFRTTAIFRMSGTPSTALGAVFFWMSGVVGPEPSSGTVFLSIVFAVFNVIKTF